MVVEKGNRIHVPASEITSKKVTVEWQQSLKMHSQDYYSVPFFNKDKGDEQSVLFIQTSYLDSFKNKNIRSSAGWFSYIFSFFSRGADDGDYTVIVDDSFQYGQNSDQTSRWLAYHDKGIAAFQWRYVASLQSTVGSALAGFGGGIFKQYSGVDVSKLSGLIGDPLHNF
ncbi:hypothetical protein CGCF415_v009305 [Colletotrichum fructicola]|uniref:Uncharacterized protein n=1 Tax=Colletotrichum fructicola (strain Nara gc5) TaxID=1213859 RepID=L2FQ28_COLFN|nr:uncharacterized protein CGMCC3_g1421 [Colletotrichum fructicola]KAF4485117.1 hypothetical protein CGGC5_v008155 [Colletotrichum fructicola Nara gc5]KAI8281983.1 hypothetical protein K4K60_003874 [Colletotrichum sp. SAR11_57]KAE9582482.1 hypothetical protein CGMCC3_g1421 [Colletotrichum fructicola]KAF4434217.1 hypothetical protein CFRS1_v013265 [Colletotrichum fructicola]KAF4900131.1 hypothetical protein CGCFRS4_v003510 [Colletotrichum fructicola]